MPNPEKPSINQNSAEDSAPTIPQSEVIFEKKSQALIRKPRNSMQRLLDITDAHLELEPDKPLDYARVRRRLGVSSVTMSKIKNRLRESGYPLPISTWEVARKGTPKRRAHRANPGINREAVNLKWRKLETIVKDLRSQQVSMKGIMTELSRIPDLQHISERTVRHVIGKALKKDEVDRLVRENRSKEELRNYDLKVRNLYNLKYSYKEIAVWIGEDNLSNINNALERLEERGEIFRRKRQKST